MSDAYEPKPGDRVLVTLALTVDSQGNYFTVDYYATHARDELFSIERDMGIIVKVEPAPVVLPTLPHAVIRAEAAGTVRVLANTDPRSDTPWFDNATDMLFASEQITAVREVLFPGVAS